MLARVFVYTKTHLAIVKVTNGIYVYAIRLNN